MKIYSMNDAVCQSTKRKLTNEVARNRPIVLLVGRKHARRLGELPHWFADEIKRGAARGSKRGEVKGLSWKSRARAMWTLGEVLGDVGWTDFLTLTYQVPPVSGAESKRHINRLFDSLASGVNKIGAKMFWWLEFQERGAIHYHVLMRGVRRPYAEGCGPRVGFHYKGKKDQYVWPSCSRWLCEKWTDIIFQTNEDTLKHSARWEMVSNPEGVGKYLVDYCNKKGQKTVPDWVVDIGRFWGVRGCGIERLEASGLTSKEMPARGYVRVVIPAHMLAGITETSGADALPYTMQWNKAQEIRDWFHGEEGQAYQKIAPALVWAAPVTQEAQWELECYDDASEAQIAGEEEYSNIWSSDL